MSNIKIVTDGFGRPKPVKEENLYEYGLGVDGQVPEKPKASGDIQFIQFSMTPDMLGTNMVYDVIPAPPGNAYIDVYKISVFYPNYASSITSGTIRITSNTFGNQLIDLDISGHQNFALQTYYPNNYDSSCSVNTRLTMQTIGTFSGSIYAPIIFNIWYSVVDI